MKKLWRRLLRRYRLWRRYGRSDPWWARTPDRRVNIDRRPCRDGREFVGIVLEGDVWRTIPEPELVELFLWADREYRKVGK